MGKKFWLGFLLILGFAYLLRVIPAQNNNFFFTMDQGNDAVHVREIIERGQILLKGTSTNLPGVHSGPGWYYFIGLGYKLFDGHPLGALFMVILLSLVTTGLLMWQIARKVSPTFALLVGTALQFFWFFYDTSRWAFNPFPLVFLAILLILLLVGFLEGRKINYILAVLPVVLGFNTEVAGAAALLVFYTSLGLWAFYTRRLSRQFSVLIPAVVLFIFLSTLLRDFVSTFINARVFFGQAGAIGTFSGSNFGEMLMHFLDILSRSIVPQSILASLLLLFLAGWLFFKNRKNWKTFHAKFVLLSYSLFLAAYFFFSLTQGWRDWHTVFLPPLLFVSILLMLYSIPKKVGIAVFIVIMAAQLAVFVPRYQQYLKPSDDPGLLINQLKVIDWVYEKGEGQGFDVYIFVPSVYDYHWQYLFWWYGRKQYGFVPCKYANHTKILKHTYIPGSDFYSQPTLGCGGRQFLIIEPGREERINKWLGEVGQGKIVSETTLGKINVLEYQNQ